jgi:hypothetical protein
MAIINQPFGAVSREQIREFESRMGLSLPEGYVAFLLSTNGGRPTPNQFYIPDCNGVASVDVLYGLDVEPQVCDITWQLNEWRDLIPEGFLAFGRDPFGNHLLLSTVAETRGRVYYWDSGYHFDESDDEGNTYELADSIELFLAGLAEPTPWQTEYSKPLAHLPEEFWEARQRTCELLFQRFTAVGDQVKDIHDSCKAEVKMGQNSVALWISRGDRRLVLHSSSQSDFDLYELAPGDQSRASDHFHTTSLAEAREELLKRISTNDSG